MSIKEAIKLYKFSKQLQRIHVENKQSVDVSGLRTKIKRKLDNGDLLLKKLFANGVVSIENYWTEDMCSQGRRQIDEFINNYPHCVQYHSQGSDRRLYGVESLSQLIAGFHNDKLLLNIGEILAGSKLYNFSTLAACIDASDKNNGSGNGWHRDSFGFQFKAILYLSDVSVMNGPFEYLLGSHKNWRMILDTLLANLSAPPCARLDQGDINNLINYAGFSQKSYLAKAGTLILAITSGIHRGRPLVKGNRYALTNYYYHQYQVDYDRICQFSPLLPGTSTRIINDLNLKVI